MAAHSDGHIAKTQRKLAKKMARIKDHLYRTENITVSESPTEVLCVQNGGLDNGISQAEILPVFQHYGTVQDVIMIPRKPFCFVCFDTTDGAVSAKNELTGYVLREGKDPSQNITLYIFFVSEAPSSICPSSEMPPGLILVPDFISAETEKMLIQAVSFEQETSCAGSNLKHRQVKHYGYEFLYGINNVDPNCPLDEEIPGVCHELLQRALDQKLVEHFPDQLTVNRYLPGQGIPPHVDTPSAFEDGLMSLSCGSQVLMDFRHPDGRHLSVLLPPRSLLVMTGESRFVWSHGITPRKSDIIPSERGGLTLAPRGVRTSFTFRKLSPTAGVVPKDDKDSGSCLPTSDREAAMLENLHVHTVYEEIAGHFSDTRHKPWPRIADFLLAQDASSILVDVGCGNGKYFGINTHLCEIGSDRSENLASICQSRGHQVFVSDVLAIPVRSNTVDVGLCIAVIHHLSTQPRRRKAVEELVRILRPGGSVLIYVWAQEQEKDKQKSKYLKPWKQGNQSSTKVDDQVSSQLGNGLMEVNKQEGGLGNINDLSSQENVDAEDSQCLSKEKQSLAHSESERRQTTTVSLSGTPTGRDKSKPEHCASDGQTQKALTEKGLAYAEQDRTYSVGIPDETCKGYDTHSSGKECTTEPSASSRKPLQVHVNRTEFKEQDMLVPWKLKKAHENAKKAHENTEKDAGDAKNGSTFHRYYHVFRQGELEALCAEVSDCVIKSSYYDQGNWCVVLQKVADSHNTASECPL